MSLLTAAKEATNTFYAQKNAKMYLGRSACSYWPYGGSSVDQGTHGCGPPKEQDEQMGES